MHGAAIAERFVSRSVTLTLHCANRMHLFIAERITPFHVPVILRRANLTNLARYILLYPRSNAMRQ